MPNESGNTQLAFRNPADMTAYTQALIALANILTTN
jgi:hypothetical protein